MVVRSHPRVRVRDYVHQALDDRSSRHVHQSSYLRHTGGIILFNFNKMLHWLLNAFLQLANILFARAVFFSF